MFEKQEYIERRKILAANFNSGVLLFSGNDESPINYSDNAYHFRQDSTFLYYFGINLPGLSAIINIDKNCTILFGDEMSIDDVVWMGQQKTLLEKIEDSGINMLLPAMALKQYLNRVGQQAIRFLPPYRAETKLKLSELFGIDQFALVRRVSVEFIRAIVAQRSVKSALEIDELDKASTISADMQLLAMQITKPGMSEMQIAAAIHQVALASGGNTAYPIIFTRNGHILHNHYHGNILKKGDLVLNDSGAETAMGYAGDITRTFPVSSKFSTKQREVYELVLKAYYDATLLLKPGVRYLDIHFRACLTLAEGLKQLGLMKGDMKEAVEQGAHALFFQCGTGHMLGLDVHDMENLGEQYVGYTDDLQKNTTQFGLKSLRLGKHLETGHVLTVEPGLYFIPELIDMWQAEHKFSQYINYNELKAYRNFGGIRVEDDYVITDSGYRKLGRELAISVHDVEAQRSA